jgi:hypothetical protein
VISSSQGPLSVHKHGKTYIQHKHWTSMPWVGFQRTVPASARAKAVHALYRSATVTGLVFDYADKLLWRNIFLIYKLNKLKIMLSFAFRLTLRSFSIRKS